MGDSAARGVGRPRLLDTSPEVAEIILTRLMDGESLRSICASEGMPSRPSVLRWLATDKAFRDQYAIAREDQADTYADEIVGIADDPEIPSDQKRVMVDARKWVASKLKAKKYGDRTSLEHSGPDGGAIKVLRVTDDEAAL